MILLDTNVVSELMKSAPDRRVETWLASLPSSSLFTTTIVEAELRYGAAVLPPGRRRESLIADIDGMLTEEFANRILPFDSAAAVAYAAISAERRRAGRPISQLDAQIAAVARSRGAVLATRNGTDFEDCGIKIINPWSASESAS
jgi:predicted nucleic acid-binding protein